MLADHEHSVFSGFRKFDPEKIQEMAIFFAKHTRDLSGTKLMKLFFYSDFYHFKNIHIAESGRFARKRRIRHSICGPTLLEKRYYSQSPLELRH